MVHIMSLPSWERGLKSTSFTFIGEDGVESLPSWERGLKYSSRTGRDSGKKSLPSWERGLKYIHNLQAERR